MQIITDLDAIKDLRRKLSEVLEELQDQYKNTEKAIETVSETWDDKQFIKFKNNFEEDQKSLKDLCEKLEDYDKEVLNELQKWIEGYLDL